jgi:hypothetical protein
MKLKRIVRDVLKERRINEISLQKGDASKHTSEDLLNEYIGYDDKFFSLVSKKYGRGTPSKWSSFYWLDQKGVRDSPLDATLQSYIKKNAIDSQGTLYIMRVETPQETTKYAHVLFDLDAKADEAIVGLIKTSPRTGKYSMRTLFGIDAQVVHWSEIATEYRGRGFGSFLYDTVIQLYGTLESDTILFSGSLRVWTQHFTKRAKVFAGVIGIDSFSGSQGGRQMLVLPLTEKDITDATFLKDAVGSFAAFFETVPAGLKQLIGLTKGLSYREGTLSVVWFKSKFAESGTISINSNNKTPMGPYEGTSMSDFIDEYSYEDLVTLMSGNKVDNLQLVSFMYNSSKYNKFNTAERMILCFEDVNIVVWEAGDGDIEYEVLK